MKHKEMIMLICHHCGKQFTNFNHWYICNKCNFRICPSCINKHKGRYGSGTKCSQCNSGFLAFKNLK